MRPSASEWCGRMCLPQFAAVARNAVALERCLFSSALRVVRRGNAAKIVGEIFLASEVGVPRRVTTHAVIDRATAMHAVG